MNKTQLVECVAATANVTKKVASETVDAFVAVLEKALVEGDTVRLAGFGNFAVKERRAKRGVNPRTGEKIIHPASKYVSFKSSKTLRETVAK